MAASVSVLIAHNWLLQLLETPDRHPSGGFPGWSVKSVPILLAELGMKGDYPPDLFKYPHPKLDYTVVVDSLEPLLDWMERDRSYGQEDMLWLRAKVTLHLAGG